VYVGMGAAHAWNSYRKLVPMAHDRLSFCIVLVLNEHGAIPLVCSLKICHPTYPSFWPLCDSQLRSRDSGS